VLALALSGSVAGASGHVGVASGGVGVASGHAAVESGRAAAAAEAHGVVASGHSSLRAFVLAGSPDSLADLEAHAGAIGVIYPTYFYCGPDGTRVAGGEAAAIDEFATAQHIVSMPRFSCQQGGAVHQILTDRALRRRTLAELVSLAANPAYGGLCLDFENDGASDRTAFSLFVGELARRLHALDKKLCVVVAGVTHENARASTGFYDDARLGALADEVFVLAWGVHWARSAPGPIAPLPWVRRVAAYFASLPNAQRFVLGVPMYGLDWARAGGAGGGGAHGANGEAGGSSGEAGGSASEASAYQYAGTLELAKAVGAKPARDPTADEMTFAYVRDGVRHTVWYLDASAITARLRVGREAGLAVGVWRLGSEDQNLWSALP
jgi:spore germination protein YaaH